MSIGIIVSTPMEAQAFNVKPKFVSQEVHEGVHVACCGQGERGVDEAILHLTYKNVQGLISWGFAGALMDDLPTGTIVIPKQIIHPFGPTYTCNAHWQQCVKESLPSHVVYSEKPIVHSDYILKTPNEKKLHALRSHGVCVDQESYYIASWAEKLNLPMIAIRVILDDAQTQLPENVELIQDSLGQIHYGELFKALLKPSNWSEFIKLKKQYNQSQQTLAQVAQSVYQGLSF